MTAGKKSIADNHIYREDFNKYAKDNPYHDKLAAFDQFVLRDEEAEVHRGKWSSVFGNDRGLNVEIGTGYGEFMLEWCGNNPNENFVGLDHRFKRSFHLAKKLDKITNKNFRYLRGRGERLEFIFGEAEVSNIFYFFPDPWPKTRHHKKRLFQKPFLDAAYKVLAPKGTLWVKTDHDGYFEWMLNELKSETRFEMVLKSHDLRHQYPDHFLAQYTTKFEKIFLSQGTLIKALELRKI